MPAILIGGIVAFALARGPLPDPASAHTAASAARTLERGLEQHRGLARFARQRLDPKVATGLLLTVALVFIVVGGVIVGVLALLVRTHSTLIDVDSSVAGWGVQHADGFENHVLDVVTHLGSGTVLLPVMLVVTIVEYIRRPNRWLFVYALVVGLGQALVTNGIKDLVERVRPTVSAAAASLGPSFPSGHTEGAAACYAAIALMMGRGRSRTTQAVLSGAAVAIAVAGAASRVLLGVHWFTDVIGGLALGWGWFAICSVAFGGRLLRFGLPVEVAERALPDPNHEPASAKVV